MNISRSRLLNQHIISPQFDTPQEVVAWMGAMQAQDLASVKWAIGLRTKKPTLTEVNAALDRGDILRTHLMRPTWHIVQASDIRWMLALSRERNQRAFKGWFKEIWNDTDSYCKSRDIIGEALCGGHSLSAAELSERFAACGLPTDERHVKMYLIRAELDSVICSGRVTGNINTYMLLDERVPVSSLPTKEEMSVRLAANYFRGHSPATLTDFVWWSGLTQTEAKKAIASLGRDLMAETCKDRTYYIHTDSRIMGRSAVSAVLLPPFDEILLGYKDRTPVLPLCHYPYAFTNNGLFFPVLLHKDRIVGNWKKQPRKTGWEITHACFDSDRSIEGEALAQAKDRYLRFVQG